jgi:precorrin-6B methylase 2
VVFSATLYFSYIMAERFIGGGNRSTENITELWQVTVKRIAVVNTVITFDEIQHSLFSLHSHTYRQYVIFFYTEMI